MLLFHENNPEDNKGISKHSRFCWQQLFGLLHNITRSLKSIGPNKTEIKIVAEKRLVRISTRARTFSLYQSVITASTPIPLSYCRCRETSYEILLIIANRRNARFPVHGSSHKQFQKAPPVFWSALMTCICVKLTCVCTKLPCDEICTSYLWFE